MSESRISRTLRFRWVVADTRIAKAPAIDVRREHLEEAAPRSCLQEACHALLVRCQHGATAAVIAACAFACVGEHASAQTNVTSYFVNDGRNDAYDFETGEFAIDTGGFVPFERYTETLSSGGHHFAKSYVPPSGAPATFHELMKRSALDLRDLDAVLTAAGFGSILPTTLGASPSVILDPDVANWNAHHGPTEQLTIPIELPCWWHCTNQVAGSGQRKVLAWPYKINGGAMMICMASDGNGEIALPEGPSSILLTNYAFHPSNYGSNKNRWRATDGRPRQFDGPTSGSFHTMEGGRWSGTSATEHLGPTAQAIEAGDIVVFVGENYSLTPWTAFLRTQEAEAFVRGEWAPNGPYREVGDDFDPIALDRSYLDGISFGALVSGFMALLQPKIYSGSTSWMINDLGFVFGDHYELQFEFDAAIGRNPWLLPTDALWAPIHAMVDLLGIRFDAPMFLQQPWDVAAFSTNRRPGDLDIPVFGWVGDLEVNFPFHWARQDPGTISSPGSLDLKFLKNCEHNQYFAYVPGVHEYSIYDGNEWSDLKAAGSPLTPPVSNPELIPTATAPAKPFPDPYSHTLRHVHVGPINNQPVLTISDIRQGMSDPFTVANPTAGSNLTAIGQGTWTGMRDTMHALDLDGDGKIEVVFGNLEGYVHVLELESGNGHRLVDEWRSPYLGRGVIGSDCFFIGANAQMLFGTATGEIWRINSTGINSYAVANNGKPLASAISTDPTVNPFPYAGPVPFVLTGQFDSATGRDILAMNKFLDWTLFDVSGSSKGASGQLKRTLHAIGPTDAFPANLDGDQPREILIAASDGFVWSLDWDAGAGTWFNPLVNVLPFTGLSLFKVVPVYFAGANSPSHLLLFGSNSDRSDDNDYDGSADGANDVIQLWELGSQSLVAEYESYFGGATSFFEEGMAFAWINKPPATPGYAEFVIAAGGGLQRYTITNGNTVTPSFGLVVAKQLYTPPVGDANAATYILSLDCFVDPANGSSKLVVSNNKGRLFLLDLNFNFLRLSTDDGTNLPPNLPPTATAAPWPSNRSVSAVYAFDESDEVVGGTPTGKGTVYFAEYAQPAWLIPQSAGTEPHYRVAAIEIDNRIPSNQVNTWIPNLVFNAPPTPDHALEAVNAFWWDQEVPSFSRSLIYRDIDQDGSHDLEIMNETGTAFVYDPGNGQPKVIRRFQTAAVAPKSMAGIPANLYVGGFVFERPNRSDPQSANYLDFGAGTIPVDPMHADFGSGANGWWYTRTNPSAFLSGQIDCLSQSVHDQELGTSMRHARLVSTTSQELSDHVVVGTLGGFVYAIEPGPPISGNGPVQSTLAWSSQDLGTMVIGLDVGDLDNDGEDEIVAGTWIDTGSYQDWDPATPDLGVNRGGLYVLDPTGSGPFMVTTRIDGDSNFLNPGTGLSSAICGVRIDDVDFDGTKEIWCCDALHVYLFQWNATSGAYECVCQSPDLGQFPGVYNNLFPIKGEDRKTHKLIVVSPGYVMEFTVDPGALQ